MSRSFKLSELIFTYVLISFAWAWMGAGLKAVAPNAIYLQWAGRTVTLVLCVRYVMRAEGGRFAELLGSRGVLGACWRDLVLAGVAAAGLGLGTWALMVLLTAHWRPAWAYAHWGLIAPAAFASLRFDPGWLWVHGLCATVLIPISEELVFRGLILRRLRQTRPEGAAIVLSALIFAVFHIDKDFVGAFALGLIFAVLAVRCASLYPPIVVHAGYNALVFLLRTGSGVGLAADKAKIASASYWWPEFLALALGSAAAIVLYRRAHRAARPVAAPCLMT